MLYFGDSTLVSCDPAEVRRTPTPALLDELCTKWRVTMVKHDGADMRLFEVVARFMLRRGIKPKAVIMPFNLRSLSLGWQCDPFVTVVTRAYPLRYADTLAEPWLHPMRVFDVFHREAGLTRREAWTPVHYQGERIGFVPDMDPTGKAPGSEELERLHILESYMADLPNSPPNLEAMRRTVRLLQRNGIHVIVYSTPVDYEHGVRYHGEDFMTALESRRDMVARVLAEEGADLHDYTFDLDHNYFQYKYMNEHLKYEGRLHVARRLQTALEQALE